MGEEQEHYLGKGNHSASFELPTVRMATISNREGGYLRPLGHPIVIIAKQNGFENTYTFPAQPKYDNLTYLDINSGDIPKEVELNVFETWEYSSPGNYRAAEISKNPQNWLEYIWAIEGTVIQIEESLNGTVFQMRFDSLLERPVTKTIIATWNKSEMKEVYEGTTLTVLGRLLGETTGENALGGSVKALTFEAFGYHIDEWGARGFRKPYSDYLLPHKVVFESWSEGALFAGRHLVKLSDVVAKE